MRLISEGSVREDDGESSVHHFFDPQQGGQPLTYGSQLGNASPDWALEDRSSFGGQSWSLADAKEALYGALTGPVAGERNKSLGATFEALGHVIHHLQDMAQPQHVRNDAHCDRFFSTWFAPLPVPGICPVALAYRPSAYEGFTKSRGRDLPLAGYRSADVATFGLPRDLWGAASGGLAEFTSNNFVSAGTNFYVQAGFMLADSQHPNPAGSRAVLQQRQVTDPDLLGPQGPTQPLSGEIWFVGTAVADQYLSTATLNPRTSTYSIFDKDLEEAGAESIFTLNRFNYHAANDFLLPRAAAYSTGLINYFFRGRIAIGLPGEGVYGVLDHATTYAAGQGFGKLKLKLSNASPDGVKPSGEKVPQTMQGGTLVAVAKYTLNGCYQPDLSGDYSGRFDTGEIFPPANCSFEQYLAGEEQLSQSAAILGASLDKTPTEFVFDFSSQPIPVNARDLRIQVVYTGTLGAEADAIAFGGRDISEPTHVVVYNNSDYFAVNGKFYTPQQIRADASLSQQTAGMNIDPKPLAGVSIWVVSGKPLTDLSGAVPVNGYVRLALLADRDDPFTLNVSTRFEGTGSSVSSFPGIPGAVIDLRNEDGYITAYGIYRGPRGNFFDAVFKGTNAPLADGELTTMSGRLVADPGPTPIPVRF